MDLIDVGTSCRGNVKVLIDAADYFRELAAAIRQAKCEILILGWDINGSIRLERAENNFGATLREVLAAALRSNPHLVIRVLSWDYSPIHSLERDNLQSVRQGWLFHPRIHFYFDDHHPLGASHHQKIVVIDGCLGFVGGTDLSTDRWDTSEHAYDNPLRRKPSGKHYNPFHDVQAQVDGSIAEKLRDICQHRWRDFNDTTLPSLNCEQTLKVSDPDFSDIECRLVQTVPPLGLRRMVREVEASYRSMIYAAKSYIYLENQYLTSKPLTSFLCDRLRQEDGPSITIVLPKRAGGWLEQQTMGHLQDNCIARLREADEFAKLKIFYPDNVRFKGGEYLTVHSKIAIVDGILARVGSSNLNDRSMGLDTECDLLIPAATKLQEDGIRHLLARLLADHSGHSVNACEEAVRKNDFQTLLVSESPHSEKILRQFPERHLNAHTAALRLLADPQKPSPDERLFGIWSAFIARLSRRLHVPKIRWDLVLTAGFILGLAWLAATRPDLYSQAALHGYTDHLTYYIPLPLAVIAIFTLGGLLFIPINLMIVAAATVITGPLGVISILTGTVANACVTYGVGRFLGPRFLSQSLIGKSQNVISRLRLSGIRTMIVIRLVPTVPNSVLNIAAGVSRISFLNFIVGTAVGILPGVIVLVYLQRSLIELVRDFSLLGLTSVVGILILFFLLGRYLQRKFSIHARNLESQD